MSQKLVNGNCRYALSYRELEEMMQERGVEVDQSTINRWVRKYAPNLDNRIRPHLKPTNDSWRVDEMSIKIKGVWQYLYPCESTAREYAALYAQCQARCQGSGTIVPQSAQVKYLNNIVEQDHRNIKRITKPRMRFKSFNSARRTLSGIETMNMIRKGQVKGIDPGDSVSPVQFIEAIFGVTA